MDSAFVFRQRIYRAISKEDNEALDALCHRLADATEALELLRQNGCADPGTSLRDAVNRLLAPLRCLRP